MNKAIKKYLDVNSDILDNKYVMQSQIDRQSTGQTRVTDKQAKKLSKLSNLAVKNDLHFKKFVKTIPYLLGIRKTRSVLLIISTP